jgi:hypothetical protein
VLLLEVKFRRKIMNNFKKVISTLTLAGALVGTLSAASFATTRSTANNGTWTYGLNNGDNGYNMAYSYLYTPATRHYSGVKLGGQYFESDYVYGGETSIANSDSLRSTTWTPYMNSNADN